MSKKNSNLKNCLALIALLISACQPAPATLVPPTASLRPSDLPELLADTIAPTSIPTLTPTLPPPMVAPPTASPTTVGLSFVETGQELNPLAASGVAVADLNGDGNLDTFVVNDDSPDGQGHRVYWGDGHGSFADSGQILQASPSYSGRPIIRDINEDSRLEVITGGTIWLNDGQGRFTASLLSPSATECTYAAEIADLNGDGDLDVVTSVSAGGYQVCLNDGQGHFSAAGQPFGAGGMNIVLGDLNGDGFGDAVTAGWRDSDGEPISNRVWFNDGKGNLSDSGQLLDEGVAHVHGLALGDLNGDNTPDIVMALWSKTQAARVFLNDGQGHFTVGQTIGGREAQGAALGDFDGDSLLDLFLVFGIVGGRTSSQVWLNGGQANFHDSEVRLGSAFAYGAALGDFNSDGKLDAFVVHISYPSATTVLGAPAEVWLNTTP